MDTNKIKQIGSQEGLTDERLNRFIHFFSNRFPNSSELNTSYCRQWANRFKDDDPSPLMDKESKDIYLDERQNAELDIEAKQY